MANPTSDWLIKQQCPFPGCQETLTFTVTQTVKYDEDHGSVVSIRAESIPESTEHAYTHKEAAK